MARPAFKRVWLRIVPAAVERSTYVLFSSLSLWLLFWLWRPIPAVVWEVEPPFLATVLWAAYGSGWVLLLISTFLIDHFDLFGLRQVVLYFRARPCEPLVFQSRLFYRFVRHPLMVSWLVIFWSTPLMTAGHLLFATTTALYILVAIQLEERDLLSAHGSAYAEYRTRVPMLLPLLGKRAELDPASAGAGGR
jgi:protein-S-isoprenylcysteine O-methyltransferase Ste14